MTTQQAALHVLIGLFVSLLLLFLDTIGWTARLRGGIEATMKPELRLISAASSAIDNAWKFIEFARFGNARLVELTEAVERANQQVLEAQDVKAENEQLKKIVGATAVSTRFRLTPARIVSNGLVFVIENKQFSPHQIVLTPEGSFVGLIEQTGIWSARVRLPTDANSAIAVSIVLPDGSTADGELRGAFGTSMVVEKVLSHVDLSPGLLVVTKGNEEVPPHLIVGQLDEEISRQESAVYQRAAVKPATDVRSLSLVMVVHEGQP